MYPDTYRINHGDGMVEYMDYGHHSYYQGGEELFACYECQELRFESDLDADDICSDCRERERENRESEDEDYAGE